MRFDFFYRTFNKVPERARVVDVQLELDAGLDWDGALRALDAAGVSMNRGQLNVHEIQTDAGIWSRPDGRALPNPDKAGPRARAMVRFRTWEQIDAEEVEQALTL